RGGGGLAAHGAEGNALMVTRDEVMRALGQVMDPEIHRPITVLDMVKDVSIDPSGLVTVEVLLTVAGCPLKDRITKDVTAAASPLPRAPRVKLPRKGPHHQGGARGPPPPARRHRGQGRPRRDDRGPAPGHGHPPA